MPLTNDQVFEIAKAPAYDSQAPIPKGPPPSQGSEHDPLRPAWVSLQIPLSSGLMRPSGLTA